VERVHEQRLLGALVAHEEVSRHPDPVHRQAEAASHFDVHHRKGDRNPEMANQHFVEKAVPRIRVLVRVAVKPLLGEEELAEGARDLHRISVGRKIAPPVLREGVEHAEIAWNVELGVLLRRDEEGSLRQGEVIALKTGERREALARWVFHLPIFLAALVYASLA
jgi:hypothetical protein